MSGLGIKYYVVGNPADVVEADPRAVGRPGRRR